MAVTDLSGTKWQINSITCSAGYGNFAVGNLKHNDTPYESSYLYIGYKWDGEEGRVATANTITIVSSHVELAVGDTIEFLGNGNNYNGLTNANLISWLEQNATQVKEPVLQITPFLTNIANAIRTKKGTTEPINAQNFASEIESIETGGGLTGHTIELDGTAFMCGVLEDGTLTSTYATDTKYAYACIWLREMQTWGVVDGEYATFESTYQHSYVLVKPAQDGCRIYNYNI